MSKKEKKARQKAKQLLREAGSKLSAKEAKKIARKADIPIQKVVQIAQRNDNIGIKVPTRTENRVQAIVEKRSQPDPPPENQDTGPTIEQIIAERDTAIAERDTAVTERDTAVTERDTAITERDNAITESGSYRGELATVGSRYQSIFDDMSRKYDDALAGQRTLQSQLSSAQSEREAERERAAELEKMRDDERELSVSQQLSSLRSGSTATGSGYTGLGSLSSGRSSYSVSTGGKSGGVLDRAYKDIDPTDSVLNKDIAIEAAGASTGASRRPRAEARRRALVSGGAGSYYARRFG